MEERIEVAKRCGADATVNAATEDPVEAVVAFSGTEGVDYVVETSGSCRRTKQHHPVAAP